MTYAVTCVRCDLRREIDELEDVLDAQEAHRAEHGEQHVVEFELVRERGETDRSPVRENVSETVGED